MRSNGVILNFKTRTLYCSFHNRQRIHTAGRYSISIVVPVHTVHRGTLAVRRCFKSLPDGLTRVGNHSTQM